MLFVCAYSVSIPRQRINVNATDNYIILHNR